MKNVFLFWILLIPCLGMGQVVDTAVVRREVDSLIDLSRKLIGKNQFDEALKVIESAEKMAVETYGKESAMYANYLNTKGGIFYFQKKYTQAEPLWLEALSIRAKTLGKEHPDYAKSLDNLGTLYLDKGDYNKAVSLYSQALSIRAKILGREHPDYVRSLSNLGGIYSDKGEYDKAEPLYLEVLAIREKTLGKEHPDYASSLYNLANLYKTHGDYDKAEPLHLKALSIRAKTLGKEHPNYTSSLNNLASLYENKGDYDKAASLYLEALAIRGKILGTENPDYAVSLNNLANLYKDKGDYNKAEPLYLEALTILADKDSLVYAKSMNNLASLYKDKGEYDKADSLYLKSSSIWAKISGTENPTYALNLYKLALLYRDKDEYDKAENYFLTSNASVKNILQIAFTYNSENEMLKYTEKYRGNFEAFFSFTQSHPTDSLSIAAYDNALFLNNALLESAIAREKAIAQADNSTKTIHSEWKSLHFRLSKQYALPIAERDSALVIRLEEKANTFEKDLVRRSTGFAQSRAQVQWSQVRDQLKPGEVAIEFIHYRYHNTKNATDSIMYAALVLLPGDTAPHFIPLCEQRQLDALITNPSQKSQNLYLQDVYWPKENTRSSLYSLLWAPLEPLLSPSAGGGRGEVVKTVYYSPSGLLHRLNLGAVGVDKRTNLSDRYRLVHLGSTRQLVSGSSSGGSSGAIIFGGIQYEMDSTAIAQNTREFSIDSADIQGSGLFKYAEPNDRTRGGDEEAWGYLPETEVEAENVGKILRSSGIVPTIRKGYAATEESFKQIGKKAPSPRILHIATHGFFFPDPKDTLSGKRLALDREPAFKISEHPMIRSGLLLAGSNYAWQNGHPMTGMEDGILTAYEISQMNLSGTELVVLSACETGLGDIQGNEGVYGLQRAFKIAGVKNILMSLWKVPDAATRELMTVFYRKWLEEKMPIRDALASAQQALRAQPKYRSPFYWAGFVLVE